MIDQYLYQHRQGHRGRRAARRAKIFRGYQSHRRRADSDRRASARNGRGRKRRSPPCRHHRRSGIRRGGAMSYHGRSIGKLAGAALAALAILALAPRAHALEIKRMTLSATALSCWFRKSISSRWSRCRSRSTPGPRRDPDGKAGLAALTAQCLDQGTKDLSAAEFNQKVDFMGSSVEVGADRDYAVAGFTSLKKYQADTLALLTGILTEPGLRDADIERKRAETGRGHSRAGRRARVHRERGIPESAVWRFAIRPSGKRQRGVGRQAHARRRARFLSQLLQARQRGNRGGRRRARRRS